MPESVLIDVEKLRVGMYVQLDIGWMNHPFPSNRFRISSVDQVQVLRDLGLRQVRYVPSKSEAEQPGSDAATDDSAPGAGAVGGPDSSAQQTARSPLQAGSPLAAAHTTTLPRTNRVMQEYSRARFMEAAGLYVEVVATVQAAPVQARERVQELMRANVSEVMDAENYAVHLLAHVAGQRQVKHSVNVMVLAMLLGRSLGLGATALQRLAAAGLLHDIGKIELPAHIAEPGSELAPGDRQLYESHVQRSVELIRRMGFDEGVVQAIGEHHQMRDGSGFPKRGSDVAISSHGQILALVNRYDRLCNPLHGEPSHTPHEALARLFAQERQRFDAATVLAAFIRMMGVYPPGSIVQLDDGRYARVVSSNAQSPLRPCVLPFVAGVALGEAPVLDLCADSGGIRRSVRFETLSDEALGFFQPGEQMCYFFERVPRQARLESTDR